MEQLQQVFASYDANRASIATPIYAISKSQAAESEGLPEKSRALANVMNFSGALGAVLAFEGGVLVGVGNGQEPLALGAASTRLAAGDYVLAAPENAAMDALGWGLGAYRFSKYRACMAVPTLILPDAFDEAPVLRAVKAAYLARDLVNTPAEDMGPDDLAAASRQLAKEHGAKISVIEGAALEKGFPLIHAVGRAASIAPRLIDLRWASLGNPADCKAITLVGKGVCFDSGGLNIKGGTGMGLMKKDMGGAANVLALAQMIMTANLPIKLRVLIPAVENAIAGNAFRPGDVFTSRQGQTVEISNTDAEGRLVLADALAYAAEENPDQIISLATLTGAARVALGPDVMPIYATDRVFAAQAIAAGERVADPLWEMPFWDRYADYLKSSIADVNHAASGSFAGSITAALFLKRFVPKEISYTHLDIFAWVPAARPGRPRGGEAMGIRALYEVLAQNS